MSVINTLEVKINGNTADLEKKLRSSATSVAKWGAASVAAAAAAGVALTAAGLKTADALAKTSRSIGGSINALQALKMAAGDTGLDGLEVSLSRMNRRLGAAEFGAGAAAGTVKALGLDLKALSEMDIDRRLQSIAASMDQAGLSSEQQARHLQNLGFQQAQAVEFFNKGIASVDGYKKEIDALGMSLSSVDAAKVEAANDAMGIFDDAVTAVTQNLAVKFAPLIAAVSEQFQSTAVEAGGFGKAVNSAYDMAINGASFVLDAVDGIKRTFEMTADGIIAAMSWAYTAIVKDLAWVLRQFDKIPGLNYGAWIDSLDEMAQQSQSIVSQAMSNIDETLARPFAGEAFKQFVAEAEAASQAAAEAAVRAQPGGIQMGEEGESPEIAARREAMEERLQILQEGLMSEMQLEQVRHDERMEALREALDLEMITRQEFMDMAEEYTLNHEDRITQMQQDAADERLAAAKAEADAKMAIVRGALDNMASLMNTSSKQAFEVGKKAAIAQAAIKGGEAIQSAWAAGMSTGGPWAPATAAAYAASAALTSANQINNIRKQSFGGGGGAPTPAGQGSSGVAAPDSGPAGGTLTVQGLSPSALFTGDVVGQIAQEMLDYQRRGGQVVLA